MISTTSVPFTTRLAELYAYRELVSNLTVRELRLKYRRSTLGAVWSLLNPVIMMAIYTAVFSVFLRAIVLPQYWALVLSGLLPWLFFANGLGSAVTSFAYNATLITKVYFPIESLSISAVIAGFVNFLISMGVLLPVLLIAGRPLGPSLILLPVIMVAEVALLVGIGLLIATLNVYFRDLEHLIGLGLTALFYLTPVLYPLNPVALPQGAARYLPFLKLNPLAWYLESYHSVLYWGEWPDAKLFTLMLAFSLLSLVAGYGVFLKLRARLPEEL